jgi:hypothetical protein
MKRISLLVGICALVGAVPALAGSPGTLYGGAIDDNHDGFINFRVLKTDDGRFVREVHFETFVRCENGKSGTLDVEVDGRFRVKHGTWEGTHGVGTTEIGNGGEATFTGKLKGGGEAKGTIKFRDEATELGICKSRTRDWEADKAV